MQKNSKNCSLDLIPVKKVFKYEKPKSIGYLDGEYDWEYDPSMENDEGYNADLCNYGALVAREKYNQRKYSK